MLYWAVSGVRHYHPIISGVRHYRALSDPITHWVPNPPPTNPAVCLNMYVRNKTVL